MMNILIRNNLIFIYLITARARRDQDEAAASAKKNRREIHLKNIRETLPEEPQPAADVAAVRFQLPQGTKLARRFHRDHTAQVGL